MPNIKALLKKMWDSLEEQKKNINQFYNTQQMTMTDLYRAKNYADLLEKNIQRLNAYLDDNRKVNPKDRQEVARSLNNIAIQTNILKAAQQAMNDQIQSIKQKTDIQQGISGKMLRLKKELNWALEKAEKILKQ